MRGGLNPSQRFGECIEMLEGRKITSQETIFTVIQERILILLSNTNEMCSMNHCSSPSSLPPTV